MNPRLALAATLAVYAIVSWWGGLPVLWAVFALGAVFAALAGV